MFSILKKAYTTIIFPNDAKEVGGIAKKGARTVSATYPFGNIRKINFLLPFLKF